uniref:Uncharacterized protein n=1 Tax=Triticum urartu TaxID=4572 RepID=A0A8R7QCX4_TRIUA
MVFCAHCQDDCPYIQDPDNGITCCGMCGKVFDEHIFEVGPTFVKNSSGQSEIAGKIIEGVGSGCSISRERTEAKGRDEIWQIVHGLHVSGGDDIICTAHNFYKLLIMTLLRDVEQVTLQPLVFTLPAGEVKNLIFLLISQTICK